MAPNGSHDTLLNLNDFKINSTAPANGSRTFDDAGMGKRQSAACAGAVAAGKLTHRPTTLVASAKSHRSSRTQLQQATDRHSDLLEHAIAEHLSKASEAIELGLTAPLASAQHLAADLHTHTDVLQLTLREQHGLVDTLASASEAMVARQELHGQRLNQELNAMYQMKLGLESVGRELNQTNTQLGLLLRSHSSSASFLYNALFVVERMVLWAAGEVEGRFGLGSLNCKYCMDEST